MTEAPDYADLAAILKRAGYTEAPSNFHGTLCGALCVVPTEQVTLESLLEDASAASADFDAADRASLLRLRDESTEDLLSTDMLFEPLLPADPTPLRLRVEALAAWCSGFLYGLSSRRKLDLRSMSEEARESLRDFSQFTQAGFDASGDLETEEAAFTELVEYVRVGAQLLFLELRPRPTSVDDESSTVH